MCLVYTVRERTNNYRSILSCFTIIYIHLHSTTVHVQGRQTGASVFFLSLFIFSLFFFMALLILADIGILYWGETRKRQKRNERNIVVFSLYVGRYKYTFGVWPELKKIKWVKFLSVDKMLVFHGDFDFKVV